jgi:hypothetical protein
LSDESEPILLSEPTEEILLNSLVRVEVKDVAIGVDEAGGGAVEGRTMVDLMVLLR